MSNKSSNADGSEDLIKVVLENFEERVKNDSNLGPAIAKGIRLLIDEGRLIEGGAIETVLQNPTKKVSSK